MMPWWAWVLLMWVALSLVVCVPIGIALKRADEIDLARQERQFSAELARMFA